MLLVGLGEVLSVNLSVSLWDEFMSDCAILCSNVHLMRRSDRLCTTLYF